MNKALITNIQKCSTKDGPGIRTTIFFKGCPLDCAWCHNPETKSYVKDIMYDEEKCVRCGTCVKVCPNHAIHMEADLSTDLEKCIRCSLCTDFCVNNARHIIGEEYTLEKVIKEIKKDIAFYESSGGGVTLSGGEAMVQIDFIEELVKECKNLGISVAIDTCGYVPFENFEKIIDYVDIFLYDLKLMNSEKHKKYTGKTNKLILDNLKKLSDYGANINIRIPLINNVNADMENILDTINFIKKLNIKSINLLPYHDLGVYKYKKLQCRYDEKQMEKPDKKTVEKIKNIFEKEGFHIKIGG